MFKILMKGKAINLKSMAFILAALFIGLSPARGGTVLASQDGFTPEQSITLYSENDYLAFDVSKATTISGFRLSNPDASEWGTPFLGIRQFGVNQVITTRLDSASAVIIGSDDAVTITFPNVVLEPGEYALSIPYSTGAGTRFYERADLTTEFSGDVNVIGVLGENPGIGIFQLGVGTQPALEIFFEPEPDGILVNIPPETPAGTLTTSATHAGILIQNTTSEEMTIAIEGVDIPGEGENLPGFWGTNTTVALAETIVENSFFGGESFSITIPSLGVVSIYGELVSSGVFVELPAGDVSQVSLSSGLNIIGDQYKGGIGFFSNGADENVPFVLRGRVVSATDLAPPISSIAENTAKTGFEITFTPSGVGEYLIQGSPTLEASSWSTIPATQVGESTITATVLKSDLPGNPSRHFFRLLQLPVSE